MNDTGRTRPEEHIGLLEELRRRKVVRVGLAYLMASWLLLQVADVVAPLIDVPESALKLMFRLLVLGFPIALLLTWAFELTPAGIRTTRRARREFGEAQHDEGIQQRRNRLAYLTGVVGPALLIGISLGAAAVWTLVQPTANNPEVDISGDPIAGAEPQVAELPPDALPTVAVLPFTNMSPDPDNAYFAAGVHEEILTRLSRLVGLRVISRTSVLQFEEDVPSLPDVARTLNASHVVEGSVRRAGDTVRITAQLIDASTDQHLWAQTYDRELVDIFEIQGQVAGHIARALETNILPAEEPLLDEARPRDLEAFDLYTQARLMHWAPVAEQEKRRRAIDLLQRSVEIDPDYVEAWQLLARSHAYQVLIHQDPDGQHLAGAESALARAQALAPGTTDTLAAEAIVLYHGKNELEAALEIMGRVRAREPARAEWAFVESWILRRLGRWDEALVSMSLAVRLDPLNPTIANVYAFTLTRVGRYEEAYQATLRSQRIESGGRWADLWLGLARIRAEPDYKAWSDLMERELAGVDESEIPLVQPDDNGLGSPGWHLIYYLFMSGRSAEAWRLIDREPEEIVPGTTRDLSAAYAQFRVLNYLGQTEHARRLAAKALEEGLRSEDPDDLAFVKAAFGGAVGRAQLAEEGLSHWREWFETAHNPFVRYVRLGNYLEFLILTDPELTKAMYLAEPRDIIGLANLAMDIEVWYPLMEFPEVRERFRGHPEWVQFMRDRWPTTRAFPFDGPDALVQTQ